MVLEFLCPNGHRIHCPEERAGRAAKCPRCGVRFQVPEVSDAAAGGSSPSLAALSGSGPDVSITDALGMPPPEDQIEFLCPNGHLLHGPASMQGRPGQCPDCGAKFRVPSYDEDDEQERTPDSHPAEREIEAVGGRDAAGADQEGQVSPTPGPTRSRVVPAEESKLSGPMTPARLFARLWSERSHGATVELHLSDGETFTPDLFAEKLSQGGRGVFAVRESDGTHTLTAVAWDAVARVVVRGVKKLPEEMGG